MHLLKGRVNRMEGLTDLRGRYVAPLVLRVLEHAELGAALFERGLDPVRVGSLLATTPARRATKRSAVPARASTCSDGFLA